jgi:hypothetical protein
LNWDYAVIGAILAILGFIFGVLISEWTSQPRCEGGGIVRSAEVQRIREELEREEK